MKNKKNVSPKKKFRLTAFIVTAVLCVAIVALGILYVSKLRMRTNAESSDNATTELTVSTEPITSAVSETTENTDELIQPQETDITSAPVTTEAQETEDFDFQVEDIKIKAFADSEGSHFKWSYSGNKYDGCLIKIEVTDGRSDYRDGVTVAATDRALLITGSIAKDVIGARITVYGSDGTELFSKTIGVENRTYTATAEPEGDVDISSLFA